MIGPNTANEQVNQPQIPVEPFPNPKNNCPHQTFNAGTNPPSFNIIEVNDIQLRNHNVPSKSRVEE